MAGDDFVWFDDVRVRFENWRLVCVVGELVVPLPLTLLHPDCRLAKDGDVGRLGVPEVVGSAARTLLDRLGPFVDLGAEAAARAPAPNAPLLSYAVLPLRCRARTASPTTRGRPAVPHPPSRVVCSPGGAG
jgi:hypothetical protein